ncbi:MAG: sugar ABC transporter substrate-binding protein, partial [Clostridium sp.]
LNVKLVTGVSGRKENIETFDIIRDQLGIDQVTYLFSPAMVRDAVKMGADILAGKTYSGLYLIPTETIDNSNYKDYMKSEHWKTRYQSGI